MNFFNKIDDWIYTYLWYIKLNLSFTVLILSYFQNNSNNNIFILKKNCIQSSTIKLINRMSENDKSNYKAALIKNKFL